MREYKRSETGWFFFHTVNCSVQKCLLKCWSEGAKQWNSRNHGPLTYKDEYVIHNKCHTWTFIDCCNERIIKEANSAITIDSFKMEIMAVAKALSWTDIQGYMQ